MSNSLLQLCMLISILSACAPAPKSELDTDALGRHIIGSPVNVPSLAIKNPVPIDQKKITGSLIATRALAWEKFATVVKSTEISLAAPEGKTFSIEVPKVFTWYSPEDAYRLINLGLEQLIPEELKEGKALTDEQWVKSQALLDDELLTLPLPLQKKWLRFFDRTEPLSFANVIGGTGLSRILYSPDLIQAVTMQYADLQNCFPEDIKPLALVAFHRCWSRSLPKGSVTIKTTWLNTEAGFYSIATDAVSLTKLFDNKAASWAEGSIPTAVPDKIVKTEVSGKTFVLGGIHIVSKELDDWLWISAWWSADPDQDFGEDRPDFVKDLGAPWNQYKICAVSSFTQDPSELKILARDHPSLAAAYRAVLDESGASWCSNPYIEKGQHNHKTNCIGCHQFAGTDVLQADIIGDKSRFPAFGRLKQREDFPGDYIWSATQGQVNWLDTLRSLRFVNE